MGASHLYHSQIYLQEQHQYLRCAFHTQAKFPILKLMVGPDADTMFVRNELSPVGAKVVIHCIT